MGRFIVYGFLLIVFAMSGCIIRTIPYDVDRADQEVKGNRGVLRGDVPGMDTAERKKTKKMYNIEIELPMSEDRAETGKASGNKGYVETRSVSDRKKATGEKRESVVRLSGSGMSGKPQVIYRAPTEGGDKYKKEKGSGSIAKEEQKTYVVKKGDTLQKISDKMYGTTKKWKKIFEANKEVLKSPDLIKPGQKLVIPE